MHHYTDFPMFGSGEGRNREPALDEFDDAREVVAALSAEYRAAERADFVRALCPPPVLSVCMHIYSSACLPNVYLLDDTQEVVVALSAEYRATERADFVRASSTCLSVCLYFCHSVCHSVCRLVFQ